MTSKHLILYPIKVSVHSGLGENGPSPQILSTTLPGSLGPLEVQNRLWMLPDLGSNTGESTFEKCDLGQALHLSESRFPYQENEDKPNDPRVSPVQSPLRAGTFMS